MMIRMIVVALMMVGSLGGQERKPVDAGVTVSEKQKKLMEDTELLVKMTAELKVTVDKTSKNELSMDVVRKAEAVEKLARSVKERLRDAR